MTEHLPPSTLTIKFCPQCGRDDRFMPFTGKSHFTRGLKCPGIPIEITYFNPVPT